MIYSRSQFSFHTNLSINSIFYY